MALFVEVAQARSFTSAAVLFDVPTSSVSRRIAALEKSLGVRLLNRTTRKVVLTEAGTRYFERCKKVIEMASDINASLRESHNEPSGKIRITAPPEFSFTVLAPIFVEFSRLHPKICIELHATAQCVDVLEERFDVAIRSGAITDTSVVVRRLLEYPSYFYASPDYLKRAGVPESPADLANHECILRLRRQLPDFWTMIHQDGKMVRQEICGSLVMASLQMLLGGCIAGSGIAKLHAFAGEPAVARGRLVRVLPDWRGLPVGFSLLTPSRQLPLKTRLFVDFLFERLKPGTAGAPQPAADQPACRPLLVGG
jgi:DNA-binding transcriptional LysR family regulator